MIDHSFSQPFALADVDSFQNIFRYLNIFRQCGTSGFYVNSEGVDSGTGKLRDKFVRKEKTR